MVRLICFTWFLLPAVMGVSSCGGCDPADPPGLSELCSSASDCADGEVCWAGKCQDSPGHQGPNDVSIPDSGQDDVNSSLDSGVGENTQMDAGGGSAEEEDGGTQIQDEDAGSSGTENTDGGGTNVGPGLDGGVDELACLLDSECYGYVPCTGENPGCFTPVVCDYTTHTCVLNSCLDDDDCLGGYLCVDGMCLYAGCRDDFDCAVGYETCDQTTRECVSVVSTGCSNDSDCDIFSEHCELNTKICFAGRRCAWDANCDSDSWCAQSSLGVVGHCEPLRECGADTDCLPDMCLPTESSSSWGFCRPASVFCYANTHCAEGQHCDLFSGRCVVQGNCGQDDSLCGTEPGYACNPLGNQGAGSCVFVMTPCTTDLNCANFEECRDVNGTNRCVPKYSCLVDPTLCTSDESCSSDGACITRVPHEACQTDVDCTDKGYTNYICARETNDGSNAGTCQEVAGAGRCNGPEDCLLGEFCQFETGYCIIDNTFLDPTNCAADPTVCSTPTGCSHGAGGCVCDMETGFCVALAGVGDCQANGDCRADEICHVEINTNGDEVRSCKALADLTGGTCSQDSDCEPSFVCDLELDDGTCMLLASAGCSGNNDCGPDEDCKQELVPPRCVVSGGGQSCQADVDCDNIAGETFCELSLEQCVLTAGGLCCTTNSEPDAAKCRTTEACTTNPDGAGSTDCAHVCVALDVGGCDSNDDCGCGDCGYEEVCDLTAEGPEGYDGVCVRVHGSDEGGCMTTSDCRTGELCIINDNGELVCVDEADTVDCSLDYTVCDETAEACILICEEEDCDWECVLVQGGGGCRSSNDCRTGEACVLPDGLFTCPNDEDCGECENLYACESNDDCGVGAACNLEVNSCELLGATCTEAESECGLNEVCDLDEEICQITGGPCGQDIDCPGESGFCDLSTGTCGLGTPCSSNADCNYYAAYQIGDLCDFSVGECRPQKPECYIDAQCTGGQACCLDGAGCEISKCYFRTDYCGDEIETTDGGVPSVCDAWGFGCNAMTQYCAECDHTDQCGDKMCQPELGMCGDFGL